MLRGVGIGLVGTGAVLLFVGRVVSYLLGFWPAWQAGGIVGILVWGTVGYLISYFAWSLVAMPFLAMGGALLKDEPDE